MSAVYYTEKEVNEKSSMCISITFYDEDGNEVTPDTATWTLTDRDGNVINSRLDVAITPATTVEISVTGDDLQIVDQTKKREKRIFLIEWEKDSKPTKQTLEFWVKNLVAVT